MIRKLCLAGTLFLAVTAICACDVSRVVDDEERAPFCTAWQVEASQAVDILFVVDNSNSMLPNQAHLVRSFPRLVQALRLPRLGGDLPDLRVGVISTDLGARGVPGDCRPFPGDGGRLRRLAGTLRAAQPWLEYHGGQTNITGLAGLDALQLLGTGFSQLANLGTAGCSYEQPLEAARMALDPALRVNPGFMRSNALLAVVFITNEDDCSVASPESFRFDEAPGFASIHRCFDLGVRCRCPSAEACGAGLPRRCTDCTLRTAGPLHPVARYVSFFRGLKRTPDGKPAPDRVVLAALAGSTTQFFRCLGAAGDPRLTNTCSTTTSLAYPAFRLHAVVDALSGQAVPAGVPVLPEAGRLEAFSDICRDDFDRPLHHVGERIKAGLARLCPGQLTPDRE